MSTRLTTGLLACLMASIFVGCVSSPESLIRGQSPAYPMPAGANSGHGFGAYSQGVPFPFNGLLGKATQSSVQSHVDAYYGNGGSSAYGPGGYPVSASYAGGGVYSGADCEGGATCENGYCQDPSCRPGCQQGYCFMGCLHGQNCCQYCNGQGCPHCHGNGYGNGYGNGGGQWAPTHLYAHKYQIPQGMVYPQNPTPGAITVYPYYTHKGPDDFFYPPLKK
jgi:hypothetical protein